MTSTEAVPDRFHGLLAVGMSPDSYPDYRNPVDGIWATNDDYTWCRVPSAATDTRRLGENGVCSRPTGHPGQHVACSSARIMAIWGDAVAAAALEPDPMAWVPQGARTLEITGWNDPRFGLYQETVSNWCSEQAPLEVGGRLCSRPAGHPAHWNHIAANTVSVLGVWGPHVDKWAAIRAGDYVSDYRGSQDPVTGFRVSDERSWCRHAQEGQEAYCTRASGHAGQHIATSRTGRVRWVEANANVPAPIPVSEPVDPEDGSPADDESLVFTVAPDIGAVVKLRDRVNRLYVMGVRATSSEVEALDLTRNELRAIPFDRCVKLTDDASVLSVDELEQVAKWYATHRDTVRRVAVREYRADRWCMDGLNRNLRSLGLSQYQPTLRGTITVSVPFEHPDAHVDTDLIQRRVTEALRNPEVSAALRLALPVVEDIELNPDGLTVGAGNFVRK